MSDKIQSAPTPTGPPEPGQAGVAKTGPVGTAPQDAAAALPEGNALRAVRVQREDGVNNPRDGRGPLRPRDDQGAKLPLRTPH